MGVSSWATSSSFPFLLQQQQKQLLMPITYRNFVSKLYLEVDEQGRTIRKRPSSGDDDDGGYRFDRERRPQRSSTSGDSGFGGRRTTGGWNEDDSESRAPRTPRRSEQDSDDMDATAYDYGSSTGSSIKNSYTNNNRRRQDDGGGDDDMVVPRNDDNDFDTWDGERPAPRPRRTGGDSTMNIPRRGPPKRFGANGDNGKSNRWDSRSSSPRFGRRDGERGGERGGDRESRRPPSSSSSTMRTGERGGGGRFNAFNSINNNNNINSNRWMEGTPAEAAAAAAVAQQGKTNMKALENAGFVHLYGLSSCRNALRANQRDLAVPPEETDRILQLKQSMSNDNDDDDDNEYDMDQDDDDDDASKKPEAQLRSWLFVQQQQDSSSSSSRSSDKATMAEEILQLAKERNVPVAYVDRGVLNTLSGNRPHQGYVLRCGKLSFEPMSRIPLPAESDSSSTANTWLVLDEVVDPQNLGALIRTCYFLGNVDILVCAKNSAPPSAVVSAASAGALEVANIYSTVNLPRTLQQAQQDGFRIIGASSSPPAPIRKSIRRVRGDDEETAEQGDVSETSTMPNVPPVYDLQDLPTSAQPTLLVLGSEGHGLRTLVARACTEFVRIPSGNTDDNESLDSLNVSVTGGILLWHLLHGHRN